MKTRSTPISQTKTQALARVLSSVAHGYTRVCRAMAGAPTGGKAYGYIAARDSGTGKVEIDEEQAAVVRRIFELYAHGASPRTIAMTLNDEGVPSPGSQWKRTSRRKSGWLASAIHGDVERGSGILNNPRYIGIVKWGRAQWTRVHPIARNDE